MKLLLAVFASLCLAPSAFAAAGFRCESDDRAMLYHSTGRFADWGKRQVTQKCAELSQNPSLCHFRGCRKVQIDAAWAKRADQERVKLNKEIKDIYADAAREERRARQARRTRPSEYSSDYIDEANRRASEAERNEYLKRIAEELERRRRGW